MHDRDFHAWTLQQSALLREGRLSEADVEHIAEKLESMGTSEQRELINRLAVLMAHLLKWQFQSELRSNRWRNTINVQRFDVKELLEENPNLINNLNERMVKAYLTSSSLAVKETSLNRQMFPPHCPFSAEQLLSEDYWLENAVSDCWGCCHGFYGTLYRAVRQTVPLGHVRYQDQGSVGVLFLDWMD
ncbi:DUF29 domain-containing protein [Candidatus Competibacter phosphatis]|uniref:DUF29 domain-containing protein n=1 Tax=Candidatus Competibacter phosphatis TaxID=221280 RepID=UPI00145C5071|nr:DUF29 domain-containing protein [Candidatus Competibacter phosphatis]